MAGSRLLLAAIMKSVWFTRRLLPPRVEAKIYYRTSTKKKSTLFCQISCGVNSKLSDRISLCPYVPIFKLIIWTGELPATSCCFILDWVHVVEELANFSDCPHSAAACSLIAWKFRCPWIHLIWFGSFLIGINSAGKAEQRERQEDRRLLWCNTHWPSNEADMNFLESL